MGFKKSSYGGYNHVIDPVILSVNLWKISKMVDHFHGLSSSVAIKTVRIKTMAESIRWRRQDIIPVESQYFYIVYSKQRWVHSKWNVEEYWKIWKTYNTITVVGARY